MINTIFDISGKIVVVTGGMGQLGQQFTKTLLDGQAKVAILDPIVDLDLLDLQLKEQEKNDELILIKADVTKRESLEQALLTIKNKWGEAPYGLMSRAIPGITTW